jgi:S-adenosylmethionine decarboxylase
MDTTGKHLLCDIWFNDEVDNKFCMEFAATVEEELTVMHRSVYEFEPVGITIAYILSESHFTLHSYPEHKYVSLDIYICNDSIDLDAILEKMLTHKSVVKMNKQTITRGV